MAKFEVINEKLQVNFFHENRHFVLKASFCVSRPWGMDIEGDVSFCGKRVFELESNVNSMQLHLAWLGCFAVAFGRIKWRI